VLPEEWPDGIPSLKQLLGGSAPYNLLLHSLELRLQGVPLDKNEGVVKIDFFAAMLCSTADLREVETEALKLSR